MKNNKNPLKSTTTYVLTDGSTINASFVYNREEFFANPDIKSNLIWLPEDTESTLGALSTERSSKFDQYGFDFESLVSKD